MVWVVFVFVLCFSCFVCCCEFCVFCVVLLVFVYVYFVVFVCDAPILVSIVVSIPACHAGDPGSIPGREASLLFFRRKYIKLIHTAPRFFRCVLPLLLGLVVCAPRLFVERPCYYNA